MPVIHVELFSGRDNATKKQLVKKLTEAYVEVCGGKPEAINVILRDVGKENWAVGGALYSDLLPD